MTVLRHTLFSICSLLLLFGVLMAFGSPALAQTNISGIINDYTPVTGVNNNCACPTADCGSISVVSASAFEVGDTVLLIQMKGAQADTSNTSSHGDITALNDAGNYEFAIISAISGNTITTAAPLGETYFTNASPVDSACVQLIRVPHYPGNVNVTGTLTAQTWNGRTGGVLAFFVDGTLTLNANISVDGQGYKAARRQQITTGCTFDTNYYYQSTIWHYSSCTSCGYNYDDSPTRVSEVSKYGGCCGGQNCRCFTNRMNSQDGRMAGFRGGGVVPNTFTKTFANGNVAIFDKGKGKWGNGGGGGGNHNAGGGGGGNYGAGGRGGNVFNNFSGGSSCDAIMETVQNGRGGSSLTPTSSRIFMGGGGGEGHDNGTQGSTGTTGGGIIFISANSITNSGAYTISADGLDNTVDAVGDGSGGGGAGGSILLDIPGGYSNTISISAVGGQGGDHSVVSSNCHGTGGGGGGGVIWFSQGSAPANVTSNISGGANGIQLSPSYDCGDINWGATAGTDGTVIYEGNSGFFNENTCGVVLPVEWISFDARALDLSIGLHWQTGTESNNDHFVIERSIDGITYREIGIVKGSGTTRSAQTYQFTDQNPISGINYYRLKQVDYNGESSYSRVVQAKINLPTIEWSIAPNPTNHSLTATLDLPWRQDGELVIMDVFGKQLVRQPITLDKGSHTINLDVSTLIPGWYVIALVSDNVRLYKKFLKN